MRARPAVQAARHDVDGGNAGAEPARPQGLRVPQRGIGGGHQRRSRTDLGTRFGGTPRHRDVRAEARTDAAAGGMCQLFGVDQRSVGKQHAELVAAQARRDRLIEGGRRFAQHRGDPAQHGITGRMPVPVVDVLETIEITDQQRRKVVVPIDLGEPLVERAAVGQVGEGILVGVSPNRGEEFPAADGDRGVGGDRLQQLNIVMAEAPARDRRWPRSPPTWCRRTSPARRLRSPCPPGEGSPNRQE